MRTLGYPHTERLLLKLGELSQQIVLVGGQAVNFWAHWFRHTGSTELLGACAPFTSKDVDIAAERTLVERMAERIGGRPRIAHIDDNAPQSGIVVYIDDDGTERILDVMASLTGIDMAELQRTRIPIAYATEAGPELRFAVMQPVLMLESRVSNVFEYDKYRTEHGLRQLKAAVICAREYLSQMSLVEPKKVLAWNERIFRLRTSQKGKRMASDYQVDVFNAVVSEPNLNANFRSIRYPQMIEHVERLRSRST